MNLPARTTRLLSRLVPGTSVEFLPHRTHDLYTVVAHAPGRAVTTQINGTRAHCVPGALPMLANELSLRLRWAS